MNRNNPPPTEDFDLSKPMAPKSDQLNADDLMGGPRLFTVAAVRPPGADGKVQIHLEEAPGRPWKPGKGMLRVVAGIWGDKASAWVGRRLVLYRDPEVIYSGIKMGGIKVSHMSDMASGGRELMVTTAKGRREPHTVKPLLEHEPAQGSTTQAQRQQDGPDSPPETMPALLTPQQSKLIFKHLGTLGLGGDRNTALAYFTDVVGHPVESSKDLTRMEAGKVIDALAADVASMAALPDDPEPEPES